MSRNDANEGRAIIEALLTTCRLRLSQLLESLEQQNAKDISLIDDISKCQREVVGVIQALAPTAEAINKLCDENERLKRKLKMIALALKE